MSYPLATDRSTTAFDVLADPRRRILLSTLQERPEPQSIKTLATDIATVEHGTPIVTTDQSRTVHIDLIHCHIPKLLEAGLVTECADEDPQTIGLADHPILEAEWVTHLLEDHAGTSAETNVPVDRTLEVLCPEQRRRLLAVLVQQRGPLDIADLAAMIDAEERDVRLVDVTDNDWEPIARTLVHTHLPALADAGLVEYDRESNTVRIAADAPQWQADWLAASPVGEIAAALESVPEHGDSGEGTSRPTQAEFGGTNGGPCWTVDGREAVIARGHDIANGADSELFVMVPNADMIQTRCLDRWSAAADRGVDVFVGSRSDEVRETVRAAIPEATVCEPQFDWLNVPVESVHHGRVVFADRDQVMLVTIDDGGPDGEPRATAITGEGTDNPLVRLVREHVGPRLDRLQSQLTDRDTSDEGTTPLPL